MPRGWEGNRRSGVALAMRHRLQWFIYLRAHGLRKGDEHPAYTAHVLRHSIHVRSVDNSARNLQRLVVSHSLFNTSSGGVD